MSLVLTVAGERWRTHLHDYAAATPGLVPVAKGNGYGFTIGRLARKAQWLHDHGTGVDTIAVGTYEELPEAATRFDGSLLVLSPWRPFHSTRSTHSAQDAEHPALAGRVIHTVGRPSDLAALLADDPQARFVLELLTSVRRHGLAADDLAGVAAVLAQHPHARCAGLALHLPLVEGPHVAEVGHLVDAAAAAGLPVTAIWVSHLGATELAEVRAAYPRADVRPRVGTDLWLGDREALTPTATVLDTHPLARGDVFGYRGRRAPGPGHLVVASGGTAHGIGLEAQAGTSTLRSRVSGLARSGLAATGVVRSPFWLDGRQLRFAEPPHLQVSMLFLPAGNRVPEVGEQVDVRVRYTATAFDRVDIV